jgi:AbrB family looped-hinge helix DNA binding protein
MHLSTLTTKCQATIPAEIRKELGLHAGDKISFETLNGKVYIVKVPAFDLAHHKAMESTLSEWNSEEDSEAYDDL